MHYPICSELLGITRKRCTISPEFMIILRLNTYLSLRFCHYNLFQHSIFVIICLLFHLFFVGKNCIIVS